MEPMRAEEHSVGGVTAQVWSRDGVEPRAEEHNAGGVTAQVWSRDGVEPKSRGTRRRRGDRAGVVSGWYGAKGGVLKH